MEPKKTEKADLEKRRGIFLQLGLVIVLAMVLIAFEWTSSDLTINEFEQLDAEALEEEQIPITMREEVQPPPPPPPPQVTEVLEVVEDNVEIDDELILEDQEVDQNTQVEFVEFDDEEEAADEGEVFFIVEDMPSFQGKGQDGFRSYIHDNLRYPEIAAENGISGRVFVQFTVNKDGSISDVKVIRGVDSALDAEALRVVKTAPKWEPGKQRGKPVRVSFTFPIVFVLQ